MLVDAAGRVLGSADEQFPLTGQSREEQSPGIWWDTCRRLLKTLSGKVEKTVDPAAIKAMGVTSTSGTVIPLDKDHKPLHPAIMYSDPRSAGAAERCRAAAQQYHPDGYTGFNSSSGLSKMLWWLETCPEKVPGLAYWIHAADYITGKLSGQWGVTDYTNALKSGYDLRAACWPSYLTEKLPLKKEWLPEVVPSGTPLGSLLPDMAEALGLPPGILVVAGMTDGCASQIASGAVKPGDWNTTIGTTLVVKGVTTKELKDPEGRIYCHRHPEGYWMPGGASNTGADWVNERFSNDLERLAAEAEKLIPTSWLSWPLTREGERFPFIASRALGFEPDGLSSAERFTANMEGVAYIERYAYELIEALSGEPVKAVYTAGGASNSDVWLRIRSNVLNRPVYKMKHGSGAAGAAILAASQTHFTSLAEAAAAMTRPDKKTGPETVLAASYEANYKRFLHLLQEKGYIKEDLHA